MMKIIDSTYLVSWFMKLFTCWLGWCRDYFHAVLVGFSSGVLLFLSLCVCHSSSICCSLCFCSPFSLLFLFILLGLCLKILLPFVILLFPVFVFLFFFFFYSLSVLMIYHLWFALIYIMDLVSVVFTIGWNVFILHRFTNTYRIIIIF